MPEKKQSDSSGQSYEQEIEALFKLEEPVEKKPPQPPSKDEE